jgi:hypothetical protein
MINKSLGIIAGVDFPADNFLEPFLASLAYYLFMGHYIPIGLT